MPTSGQNHPFVVPRAILPGLAFPVVHQLLNIEPCHRALKNDCLHDGKSAPTGRLATALRHALPYWNYTRDPTRPHSRVFRLVACFDLRVTLPCSSGVGSRSGFSPVAMSIIDLASWLGSRGVWGSLQRLYWRDR